MLNTTSGGDIVLNAWNASDSITTPDIIESFFDGPFAKKVEVPTTSTEDIDSDVSRFIAAGKEALKSQTLETPNVEVVASPNDVCGTRFLTPLQVAKSVLPKVMIKQEPMEEELRVPQTADIIDDIISNESHDDLHRPPPSNHFFSNLVSMSQQQNITPFSSSSVTVINSTPANPSYSTIPSIDFGAQSAFFTQSNVKIEPDDSSNSHLFSTSHSVSPSPTSTTGSMSDYEASSDNYLHTTRKSSKASKSGADFKKSRLTSRQKEQMMKQQVEHFMKDNQFCKQEIQRMEREIVACKKLIQEAFAQKTQMQMQ